MTVVALLADAEHVLFAAVLERGMMEGLTFTVPPEALPPLQQRYAMALKSFPDAIQGQKAHLTADWSIELIGDQRPTTLNPAHRRMKIGFDVDEGIKSEDGTFVSVHGMLPPAKNSNDARVFRTWLEHHQTNTQPDLSGQPRHWCDRSDLAYAIVELLKSEPTENWFNLSGRRQWTLNETWMEFSELMNRTKAGKTGRFNIHHLEARGVPSIKAVSVESTSAVYNRPSLHAIHAFLEERDGEGWRPKTPLRHSLMFVIAMHDEHQAL